VNGPPLSMADAQNNSIVLGANVPEIKVVVYFTDGLMNALQDQFNCTNLSGSPIILNYGGFDATSCPPGTAHSVPTLDYQSEDGGNIWGQSYIANGLSDNCGSQNTALVGNSSGQYCKNNGNNVTTFPSQSAGMQVALTRENVTADAQYRAIYTANQMRGESPIPTYIYTIGLGTEATVACVEAFLATVANDPNGSNYSCPSNPAVYNSSLPQGEFFPVPSCPGSQCTSELTYAFQVIAQKVLLRLSE
jgi:hypothetical protein